MKQIINVRYCDHCGHKAPQKVVYHNNYVGDFYEEQDGSETPLYFGKVFLAECQTCFKFSLFD